MLPWRQGPHDFLDNAIDIEQDIVVGKADDAEFACG
jgi:hypothetical protein